MRIIVNLIQLRIFIFPMRAAYLLPTQPLLKYGNKKWQNI